MGLGEWDEILRYAQDGRRGRRVKRGFAGRGQRLEIVRRRRRKQVPRYAWNDNLGEFRRVGEMRRGERKKQVSSGPIPARRIRRAQGVKECAAKGPVAGVGEVASGEWRVTSDN
jgi:hypothetical protein